MAEVSVSMSRKLDYALCGFLFLCALGHFFGTLKFYDIGSAIFAWSLSGVVAALLLAYMNLVRLWYPSDRRISVAATLGNAAWIVVVLLFGQTLGTLADPRVLMHGLTAAGLLIFSLKSFMHAKHK